MVYAVQATQRRSSLTFYLWDLQANLKRPLEAIFGIVVVLSALFFWSSSSLLKHICITKCPVNELQEFPSRSYWFAPVV